MNQIFLSFDDMADTAPICTICLDDLNSAPSQTLPCYHVYHHSCIENYARVNPQATCPICRTPFADTQVSAHSVEIHQDAPNEETGCTEKRVLSCIIGMSGLACMIFFVYTQLTFKRDP